MKSMLSFLLPVFLIGCTGKQVATNETTKVEWLIGIWDRVNAKEGVSAHERWERISETELEGWGVAMRNGDTSFVEKLSIIVRNDTLHYVADVVDNPEPVFFKFTSIAADGFVSENPTHDFPKKIQYQLVRDTLTATTSGDGRGFAFKFVKRIQ